MAKKKATKRAKLAKPVEKSGKPAGGLFNYMKQSSAAQSAESATSKEAKISPILEPEVQFPSSSSIAPKKQTRKASKYVVPPPKTQVSPPAEISSPLLTPQQRQKTMHLYQKHAHEMNENTFGINFAAFSGEEVSPASRYLVSLVKTDQIPSTLGPSLLLDVDYDGHLNKAYAKLYNLEDCQMYLWVDTTNHKPYCLCPSPPEKLQNYPDLATFDGLDRIEVTNVYDLLQDRDREVSRIVGHTPTDIGGAGRGARGNIKSILTSHNETAWEANIRYHHNFIFDRSLIPGLVYSIREGKLVKEDIQLDPTTSAALTGIFEDESPDLYEYAQESVKIFEAPIPDIRRMAMDIEVAMENGKVPNPRIAREPVICISFVSNDGLKKIFVLAREEIPAGEKIEDFPEDLKIEIFADERELLRETLRLIWEYPIVITFNGDNFDFHYLYNRATKLKIPSSEIPFKIRTQRSIMGSSTEMDLFHGIHVDLYKFFSDRSIKGYAFGNKYGQNSLDSIANALLGQGKFPHAGEEIHEMSLFDLMYYNWKDSDITFQLTTFDGSIVMRLLILFLRMTKLPLHDFYRNSISSWIRTMLYYEHRQRTYLIPSKEDIAEKFHPKEDIAGKFLPRSFSTSITKGKQFQGAYVVDPVPGRHYGVVVMDFASLYPTIIKEYNLSYETINCGHPECQNNLVPNTPYYACTRRMGIFALLTGFFREIRIKWYKRRAGDKTLPPEERSFAATIQSALKVFINGSYGVFGSRQFPLFALPVGESTTAIGRYSINHTIEKAKELGAKVLYGDTDSVFLLQPTQEQISALTQWSEKELKIDLEVDKTYQFLALSSRKKNYAGIYGNGGVDIKGLTGKKKNTPEFIKKIFLEVLASLKEVRSEEDFFAAKETILSTIRKNVKKLERREFPIEDFEISVQMKKKVTGYTKNVPQHVRAAMLLKESKEQQGFEPDLERGDTITYVKTRSKEGVKPTELARPEDLDIKKYKEMLQSSLEQVLDALDISFDEVMGVKKIDSYFNSKK